jgi:hypothetical protein
MPTGKIPADSAGKDTAKDHDSAAEDTHADTNDAVDTAEDTAEDTAASDMPCGEDRVDLVGIVYYGMAGGDTIYSFSAGDGEYSISLAERDDVGEVHTWTLKQVEDGYFLDEEYDLPDSVVTGKKSGDYLGVRIFRDVDEGLLCSQTYGDHYVAGYTYDNAGRLVCWPTGLSGVVDDLATVSVYGDEDGAFMGYGCDASGDGVYAMEASSPHRLYHVHSDSAADLLFTGACDGHDWCQSCSENGYGLILASDEGWIGSYQETDSGMDLAWGAEQEPGPAYQTFLYPFGGDNTSFARGSDGDQTIMYDNEDGSITDSIAGFQSSLAIGRTFDAGTPRDSYIATAFYKPYEDGAAGGLIVYDSSGEKYIDVSWAELLQVEDPGSFTEMDYVDIGDIGGGYLAFADLNGAFTGILRICKAD